jgi:HAD superfamily hydrolase (TIGR01549 family)
MKFEDYIQIHNKTHLIFDFDATLVLLLLPWHKWHEGLRKEFTALDAEIFNEFLQQTSSLSAMQNMFVDRVGDKALPVILRHNEYFENEFLEGSEPYTELIDLVKRLGPKYKKYVWSSNSRRVVERVLAEFNLSAYFDGLVTRNEVKFIKPDPEGFTLIRQKDVPLARYVLVGDSSHDRNAAAAAGIDFYHDDHFQLGR